MLSRLHWDIPTTMRRCGQWTRWVTGIAVQAVRKRANMQSITLKMSAIPIVQIAAIPGKPGMLTEISGAPMKITIGMYVPVAEIFRTSSYTPPV